MNRRSDPVSGYVDNPLVLQNRVLRPGYPAERLSRFWDADWDLTPGIFEEHSASLGFRFDGFGPHWAYPIRSYLWFLLNSDEVRPVPGSDLPGRPSVRTVFQNRFAIGALFDSLDAIEVADLSRLDQQALEQLAIYVNETYPYDKGRRILVEVRRLWVNRDLVEPPLRMPSAVPWNGDRTHELLSGSTSSHEIRTKRISDATLIPLMAWARRLIEDLSDDIIASYRVYFTHTARQSRYRSAEQRRIVLQDTAGTRSERVVSALEALRASGLGLPGYRRGNDSVREVNWAHLARLAGSTGDALKRTSRSLVEESGLELDEETYVPVQCTGTVDGRLWRERPIPWDQMCDVATHLQTACFLTIAYLSGMRPGEVLSLERDCLEYDPAREIWVVRGKRWKAARDDVGQKAVDGEIRDMPWVVHSLAARAIQVLSELHQGDLLFPSKMGPQLPLENRRGARPRPGAARTSPQMATDITNLTNWVNAFVRDSDRDGAIPEDPDGNVSPSRLRRTLAWHIVRRPRGLVAAAIQYGHVATLVTQGYAGTLESGFPDEISFETWLERAEHLSEINDYIEGGGHVSGPAASELRVRARESTARFAGRVVPTRRQAVKLMQHPSMQVFEGDGIHCVFALATALCIDTDDSLPAPRPRMCRSQCTNIARTDSDIIDVRSLRSRLASDTLAPAIRHERNLQLIDQLDHVLDQHEQEDS